jgi:hypothetical protein
MERGMRPISIAIPSLLLALSAGASLPARAALFTPGDLVVSTSTYQDTGAVASLMPGQTLPGGGTAVAGGSNLNVFFNATPDGSFGVTSPIELNEYQGGVLTPVLALPTTSAFNDGGIVTSFSSKSELSLNLSQNGQYLTLMGYAAPVGALDVSNSGTPGAPEPGNPVNAYINSLTSPLNGVYREVAEINANGQVTLTQTNAFSGNNGRAAILANNGVIYMVGNAGNGNGSVGVTYGAGLQYTTPGAPPIASITAADNTQVAKFVASDNSPKDNNFRGIAIDGNYIFVDKGSGSKGINSVYQVGNGSALPTGNGNPIVIPNGFPTTLNKDNPSPLYPFGLFFANPDTLYIGDEGPGTQTSDAAAGLEKWSLVGGTWKLDYTLQAGLGIGGSPYDVADYGDVYTEGLRDITGKVNSNGTAWGTR